MARRHSRFASRFETRFKPRYQSRFSVVLSDYTASIEEWRRAQKAPAKDLPELSPEQVDVARKFGLTEEAYARSLLAGKLGTEKMRERAVELGKIVGGIAGEVDRKCKVVSVVGEMFKGRWLVRLQTPGGNVVVAIPRELVDDVLDSEVTSEMQKLRSVVRDALVVGEGRR